MTELRINHIHLPFGFDSLRPMFSLHHLTINLRYDNQLLDLCAYLRRVESFRVEIQRSSHSLSDPSFNHVDVSLYLRWFKIDQYCSSNSRQWP